MFFNHVVLNDILNFENACNFYFVSYYYTFVVGNNSQDCVVMWSARHSSQRPYRDDSQYTNDKHINTGNFSSLLRYRADGGDELLHHMNINNDDLLLHFFSKTFIRKDRTNSGGVLLIYFKTTLKKLSG